MMQLPIGTTVAFAGSTEPLGWKWANGQSISHTGLTNLVRVLATIGIVPPNGTIPLPDLRGRAPIAPVSPAVDPFGLLGDRGAYAGPPDHAHIGSSNLMTGFDIIDSDPVYGLKHVSQGPVAMPGSTFVSGNPSTPHTAAVGPGYNGPGTSSSGWLGDAGGGPHQTHENRAPYIVLNFIIKITGEGVQGYPVGSLLPFAGAAARISSFTTIGGQSYANTYEPHGFVVGDRVHIFAPDCAGTGEYQVGPTASANQLGLLGSVPAAFAAYGSPPASHVSVGYVSPAGWLVTTGGTAWARPKVASLYTPLYGVIGGVFGETEFYFNLPDTRGRIVHGRDNMSRGADANMIGSNTLGTAGGVDGDVLTLAQIAAHRHTSGSLAAPMFFGEAPGYGVYPEGLESIGYQGITQVATYSYGASHAVTGFTGNNPNAGAQHNNMPRFVAVPHLIKY